MNVWQSCYNVKIFMCGVPTNCKSMDAVVATDADTDANAVMFNYACIQVFCNVKKLKRSIILTVYRLP